MEMKTKRNKARGKKKKKERTKTTVQESTKILVTYHTPILIHRRAVYIFSDACWDAGVLLVLQCSILVLYCTVEIVATARRSARCS